MARTDKRREMALMRAAINASAQGLPTLQQWLDRVSSHGDPLKTAVEGIWCGSEGRASLEIPGTDSLLIVGWYSGRVEYAYIS